MITYTVATNLITVTGYSLAVPCNFTDLYNADKAGTLSLHARTGITVADGAAVAVDRAERPADYIVLGGASNDLYITIANWNGTTATIRITGTDRDGAAQTEDIVVNANGQYNTTKWFKTITHTQVTSATATSFDYDLTQGQWGVVWKTGNNNFYIECYLEFGDGSTATYFTDTNKQITMSEALTGDIVYIKSNTTLTFGELIDEAKKTTRNGCQFLTLVNSGYARFRNGGTGKMFLYSSAFKSAEKEVYLWLSTTEANNRIWNCLLDRSGQIGFGKGDVDTVIVTGSRYAAVTAAGTWNNLFIKRVEYAVRIGEQSWNFTFKNFNIVDAYVKLFRLLNFSTSAYLINVVTDGSWNFYYSTYGTGDNSGTVYRQYEFDLKVTDKDENDINGASVKIWDKDDVLLVDTTTSSGIIATQTITRKTYKAHNLTGSGTEMDEVEKSPFTLEIRKAGYKTYKKKFTLDSKTDWTIALQKVLDNNFSKRVRINNY